MKKLFWALQILIVIVCTSAYYIIKQGDEGNLGNSFVKDKIYPFLITADGAYTNLKFRIRGSREPEAKIVIVAIDDESIEKLGRWPWSRDIVGFLTHKIIQSGAKVVGFDAVFSETREVVPEDLRKKLEKSQFASELAEYDTDSKFTEVVQSYADKIVLGWASETNCRPHENPINQCNVTDPQDIQTHPQGFDRFSIKSFVKPEPFDPQQSRLVSVATFLSNIQPFNVASKHQGAFMTYSDADGFIRRATPIYMANGNVFPSLPLAMTKVGLGDDLHLTLDDTYRVQDLRFIKARKIIPVNSRGDLKINFLGPSYTFPYVPAVQVMSEDNILKYGRTQEFSATRQEIFKDAYVLIGASAIGVYDMRVFPFDENTPGVEGHASILENILSENYLMPESANWTMIVLALMAFGGIIFAALIHPLEAIPNIILSVVSLGVLGFIDQKILFAQNQSWHLLFAYTELGFISVVTLGFKYIAEERQKKFIHGAFGKYVSPAVVEAIVKDPTRLSLGGAKQELSILFSDIRGFTTFSERLDAKVLAALLYDYLGMMTDIIVDGNQGTLDKYIGDAIMAFWGAPIPAPDNGFKSLQAAITMQRKLDTERDRLTTKFGASIDAGIGINTGVVSVGNMGSAKNFSYTVIGDHVNLASRVEGLTKYYGASILTTHFTMAQIKASGQKVPDHRVLDKVMVKGKNDAIELVEVFHRETNTDHLGLFQDARNVYTSMQWKKALQLFGETNDLSKQKTGREDKTALMYMERIQEFETNPPPAGWDGAYHMTAK